MTNPHIVAEGMVVEFPVLETSHRSLKKAVLRATTGGRVARDAGDLVVIRALDGLDFEFKEGDRVGITGHNGSGKTTLLRVLSGIYRPVRGRLEVRGRVASLLDVFVGIDPDATGFENIYLRGLVLGIRPAWIRRRIEQIAEFSELGDYLNLPVRTYSSGMALRLAFSISTSIEADIVLMDEWLSVGDAAFSVKAEQRLQTLAKSAAILVMASHNQDLIARMCNRVIRLEQGRQVEMATAGKSMSA